jgi:PAS domain S-box-containing protein
MLQRLRELVDINRAIISSLDYDQVLRLVVDKTAAFTAADSCALLLTGADNLARIVAFAGISPEHAAGFVAPLDERINVALRDLVGFRKQDTFIGVPVIDHGRIRGALVVHRRGGDPRDTEAEQEFLLSALADQAAIALANAARYRDVHRLSEHKSRLLETIQSNATSYLAYLDAELRFVEVNTAYCQALGCSREEIIGKRYADVATDWALLPLLETARDLGEPVELGEVVHRPAGEEPQPERYWDCSARPVLGADAEVAGVVVSAVDVTDRVVARTELEAAGRRKDEFLAMLAHELRNPLAAIANAMEVLRPDAWQDPAMEELSAAARRQIAHMKRLLDDLLDVARITRGQITLERRVVDLASIVNQAVHSSAPLIQAKGHELSVALPGQRILVEADPDRLVQVVSNLLSNAAKFTDTPGQIALSVQPIGDEVEIRVRDSGVGIEREMLPVIFDLFVQAKSGLDRRHGGLGLGLTLVKRLVDMHGGRVEAHSAGPGRGSELVVRLPVAGGAPISEQPPRQSWTRISGLCIVLVEDHPDVASTMAAVLRSANHRVLVAHDGPSGIELVKRHHPQAVLLDIGLPGMNGYEVAERLHRELGADTPLLIAMTGYGQKQDRLRAEQAGIDHYLIKPVDLEGLLCLLASEACAPGA